MQIEIEGIAVDLQKKNIKNLHIAVYPDGRVRVSVPKRMKDEAVRAFVLSRLAWIEKHREAVAAMPREKEKECVSGETFYVFDRKCSLKVIENASKTEVCLLGDEIFLFTKENTSKEKRKVILNDWYRALLKEKISFYLPKWEAITGLFAEEWHVKDMSTRWGSCNPRAKRIWLSLSLAQKPVGCLEYVILHELTHIKVKNHGKDFKALLDIYMPSWREKKKLLNQKE